MCGRILYQAHTRTDTNWAQERMRGDTNRWEDAKYERPVLMMMPVGFYFCVRYAGNVEDLSCIYIWYTYIHSTTTWPHTCDIVVESCRLLMLLRS